MLKCFIGPRNKQGKVATGNSTFFAVVAWESDREISRGPQSGALRWPRGGMGDTGGRQETGDVYMCIYTYIYTYT